MKQIEGKNQRYLLANEEPKGYNVGDYYLKEIDTFTVGLYYINNISHTLINEYTKEYSKKVSNERLEQIIREHYD